MIFRVPGCVAKQLPNFIVFMYFPSSFSFRLSNRYRWFSQWESLISRPPRQHPPTNPPPRHLLPPVALSLFLCLSLAASNIIVAYPKQNYIMLSYRCICIIILLLAIVLWISLQLSLVILSRTVLLCASRYLLLFLLLLILCFWIF